MVPDTSNNAFLADGITLGIPNTSATEIQSIDNAIFTDANGNLHFRDNYTANLKDVLGNPVETLTLQDLYTRIKGVFVSDGKLYFKDATTTRAYSLQEIVGSYVNWKNKLTNGGIFWIGSKRFSEITCNNLIVNINGDPTLATNTDPSFGVPRLFDKSVGNEYPLYETGTKCFSFDQYLKEYIGNWKNEADGSWKWHDVPSLAITIPPVDSNKIAFILAKTNLRLIQGDTPIVFRLYDRTISKELDRKAVQNATPLPTEEQITLSYTGHIPTVFETIQKLNCQCPTAEQTASQTTEPTHEIVIQFHLEDQYLDNANFDIYGSSCQNISGNLYVPELDPTDVRYKALERRIIGLPNSISSDPIVQSSIDIMIFDTTPTDIVGRKAGSSTFNNGDLMTVTFDTAYSSSEYSINLSNNKNINVWYTNRTNSGFTIRSERKFIGQVDWVTTKLKFEGNA
jgi:hypothetical protein